MSAPSEYVKDILVTKGLGAFGGTADWAIFISKMMAAPHKAIAIYDTPGEAPNPKFLLNFPTFQVMVRGSADGYQAAWQKAKDVQDALLGIDPANVTGGRIDGITQLGDIFHNGYDQSDRPLVGQNFRMIFEPSTSALTQREPL